MPKDFVYINGKIEKANRGIILAKDQGLLFGDGVYDTIRVYSYKLFMRKEHMARLTAACKTMEIDIPPALHWENDIDLYVKKAQLRDGVLRITVTRGVEQANVLFTHRAVEYTPANYQNGFSLQTSSILRNAFSPITYIKSLNRMDCVLAKREAVKAGYSDALLLNTDKIITECSSSNLFFIKGKTIYTPAISCGLLNGIARELIISKIAAEIGVSVVEGAFTREDLYRADEVFISNSVIQIMPVIRVDEHRISLGVPGRTTNRIAEQYEKHIRES